MTTNAQGNTKFFPVLQNDDLEKLPSMLFDFTLCAQWTGVSDGWPVKIPVCIGAPFLCLRELHEYELKEGRSFLDDFSWSNPHEPKNLQGEAEELTDWLLNNATAYPDCRDYLMTKSPRLLFESILGILKRTAKPIYPLSPNTCKILVNLYLHEPAHPYPMYIGEVLLKKVIDTILQDNEMCLTNISRFIQETFFCNRISRDEVRKLTKMLNQNLFHDIHMVKKCQIRNIIRFIIRGMVFLLRRYVFVVCNRIRMARGESFQMNYVTVRPHVLEYAILTLAERLGSIIFRFPKCITHTQEMAVRAMTNILCSNTDRLWMPDQTPSSINIGNNASKCHPGCTCNQII